MIITEKGTCDRSYRYPVRITDGSVGYAGQASFNVSGRVEPERRRHRDGEPRRPARRAARASSSATDGGGSWSGGDCSGTWEAERRS